MHSVIKAARVVMRSPPAPKIPVSAEPAAPDASELAESELNSAKKASAEMLDLAHEEASHVLREARGEALEITKEAETRARELHETTREEAYRQGLGEAEREIGDLFERAQGDIDRTIEEAKQQCDALIDKMEPRIFKLTLEVAEKILGYELDHNESAFMSMLREALGRVKNESRVTLRVNPSEYVRFFKSREMTIRTSNGSINADIVNDPSVGYGGCLIETKSGSIDAGLDAQLAQIGRNLGLED